MTLFRSLPIADIRILQAAVNDPLFSAQISEPTFNSHFPPLPCMSIVRCSEVDFDVHLFSGCGGAGIAQLGGLDIGGGKRPTSHSRIQ